MKPKQSSKKKMVIIASIAIGLLALLLYPFETDWSKQLDKDAVYLDVDSVYRTPAEKEKIFWLKEQFLSQYMDTSNCFTDDYQKGDYPDSSLKKVLDVHVDNILHTKNYDTVIVLVSFYAAWLDEVDNGTSECVAMKATIGSTGKWDFNCNQRTDWLVLKNRNLEQCSSIFRRTMIAKGILNERKEIDPAFFHRFFTEDINVNVPREKSWWEHLPESGPVK